MSSHYLSGLFAPASAAVIGATEREGAVGRFVFQNLHASAFQGPIYAVNPKHSSVFDSKCYPDIHSLPATPDLIVVTTPAETVAEILAAAGEKGVRHALVLSAGFAEAGEAGQARALAVGNVVKRFGIRLLGPNCIGVMRPAIGFNATFSNTTAHAGSIALISQSGAVCTAFLDWAATTNIGFSSIVSLGGALDLDFGEIIDFFLHDSETKSILLYVEGVRDARTFVSALRAAAKVKPVIILKAGRGVAAGKAVASHTGALTGNDAVFDAVLARSGAIRVRTSAQLFAAARIFADGTLVHKLMGDKLAIITNGGGAGVVASDCAADNDIKLASLSPTSIATLNKNLPAHWSHQNPIDLIGDATPARFSMAVTTIAADPNVDAILVLFCPQTAATGEAAAAAIIDASRTAKSGSSKPVFAAWLGGASVQAARALFDAAHVPHFLTPENAVEAFSCLTKFRRHQQLMLSPAPASQLFDADEMREAIKKAENIRAKVRSETRTILHETEAKEILAAFGLPVHLGVLARTREAAQAAAKVIGYPVAMKIQSPDITHKSDVGGVRLNLTTARQVGNAFDDMVEHVHVVQPGAAIEGVNIQPMLRFAHAREVLVGLARDAVFGPVVAFGAGGVAVEAIRDTAVTLPPLDSQLAANLIRSTRISRILGRYRNTPAADESALVDVLMRVSAIACALPWVRELDINPLLAHAQGAAIVDARMVIDENATDMQTLDRYAHLAIHPYPIELEQTLTLKDGAAVHLRAIRPDDAERERAFMASLSPQTRYYRFLHPIAELSQDMIARFTQIDYAREMALIALDTEKPADSKIIGVARYYPNQDYVSAEFAVAIGDAWQKRGLGAQLMKQLIECATRAGYSRIEGTIHPLNVGMLRLATSLGFAVESLPAAPGRNLDTVRVTLKLARVKH